MLKKKIRVIQAAVLRKRRFVKWLLCIGLVSLTCSGATKMQGQDVYADATLHDRLLQSDLPLADEGVAPAHVKLELKALSLLSAPVIVQLTALYAISTVNQYFIGHLGAAPLAAAAIGNTVSTAKAQVSASCDRTYERDLSERGSLKQLEHIVRRVNEP